MEKRWCTDEESHGGWVEAGRSDCAMLFFFRGNGCALLVLGSAHPQVTGHKCRKLWPTVQQVQRAETSQCHETCYLARRALG